MRIRFMAVLPYLLSSCVGWLFGLAIGGWVGYNRAQHGIRRHSGGGGFFDQFNDTFNFLDDAWMVVSGAFNGGLVGLLTGGFIYWSAYQFRRRYMNR